MEWYLGEMLWDVPLIAQNKITKLDSDLKQTSTNHLCNKIFHDQIFNFRLKPYLKVVTPNLSPWLHSIK